MKIWEATGDRAHPSDRPYPFLFPKKGAALRNTLLRAAPFFHFYPILTVYFLWISVATAPDAI